MGRAKVWVWVTLCALAMVCGCGQSESGGHDAGNGPLNDGNGGGDGDGDGNGDATGAAGGSSGNGGGSGGGNGGGNGGGGEGPPDTTGECGLDTGFIGDDQCILPPPPDKGFQIHIGPDDYDNIPAEYLLDPGEERTDDFPATSSNAEDRHFYRRQYRMRPTAHHMIVSAGGGIGGGHRIATANLSQDFPADGTIAPENEGVGIPIAAHEEINVSLHAINTTETPQLREIWVNFWYRDSAEVTEEAEPVFEVGSGAGEDGFTFAIPAGAETVLGPYTCRIGTDSRMLWLYGHRHANNVRFSVWRQRGATRDVLYEGFHWEEPLLLQYSSLVDNPTPDRATHTEGGWSGRLDLAPGDEIQWECEIVNTQASTLRFSNETYTGEMCIIDAEIVGANCL